MPDPEGSRKPQKVTFKFEFDPGYRIVAVNGIWGSITTRGDLRLDFFVESTPVPEQITNKVTDEGLLGEAIAQEPPGPPDGHYTRRMQTGVLLSLDCADSIADFIKAKVAEFKKRTAQNQTD